MMEAETTPPILTLPVEILLQIYRDCDSLEAIGKTSLTCKKLNNFFKDNYGAVVGDYVRRHVPAFDDALLSVRCIELASKHLDFLAKRKESDDQAAAQAPKGLDVRGSTKKLMSKLTGKTPKRHPSEFVPKYSVESPINLKVMTENPDPPTPIELAMVLALHHLTKCTIRRIEGRTSNLPRAPRLWFDDIHEPAESLASQRPNPADWVETPGNNSLILNLDVFPVMRTRVYSAMYQALIVGATLSPYYLEPFFNGSAMANRLHSLYTIWSGSGGGRNAWNDDVTYLEQFPIYNYSKIDSLDLKTLDPAFSDLADWMSKRAVEQPFQLALREKAAMEQDLAKTPDLEKRINRARQMHNLMMTASSFWCWNDYFLPAGIWRNFTDEDLLKMWDNNIAIIDGKLSYSLGSMAANILNVSSLPIYKSQIKVITPGLYQPLTMLAPADSGISSGVMRGLLVRTPPYWGGKSSWLNIAKAMYDVQLKYDPNYSHTVRNSMGPKMEMGFWGYALKRDCGVEFARNAFMASSMFDMNKEWEHFTDTGPFWNLADFFDVKWPLQLIK